MEKLEFEGTIEAAGSGGACIPVPFDPGEVFGTRRSVRVNATYDGFHSKSNVVTMGGRAVLGIHKATRQAIGKEPGDTVRVTLVRDSQEPTVDVPPELADALSRTPGTKAKYDALAYTHRKEFARWIAEAKRDETRERRLGKTLEMIEKGEKL